MSQHRIRITFENEPQRNGSTMAYPPSRDAAMRDVGRNGRCGSPATVTHDDHHRDHAGPA